MCYKALSTTDLFVGAGPRVAVAVAVAVAVITALGGRPVAKQLLGLHPGLAPDHHDVFIVLVFRKF